MAEILKKIVNNRLMLIREEKKALSLEKLKDDVAGKISLPYEPVNFLSNYDQDKPFLIAEIKRASPSKGMIREDLDVGEISGAYHNSPFVSAISVLSEPDFFSGSYKNINLAASAHCVEFLRKGISGPLPILMKDFIVDEYQVYRGFMEGASAFLLIASILSDSEIVQLRDIAIKLGMEVLFEVHSSEEYKRAIDLDMKIIGINNRDLRTFEVDIGNTVDILASEGKSTGKIVISESGIHSKDDIDTLLRGGADGFLVGEHFMTSRDIEGSIRRLMDDK
ncbi:indole-3-glycerol-phosphate synthase [Spirochaetota bacterium]